MGNVNASEDAKRYRDAYPGKQDDPKSNANLEFYSDQRSSKPEGDTIENIHKKWKGNYGLLEAHHGYIQWLFPIREDGLNHYASQLQLHEAAAIAHDPVMKARVITSYELMLDFYGMVLVNQTTGEVARNPVNWRDRYAHLNRSFHNYLRITRILKFLGEVELEHFKIHFVMHILKEIFENDQLKNCKESCIRYWAPVLRLEADRTSCEEYVRSKIEEPYRKPKMTHRDDDSQAEKKQKMAIDVKRNEDDSHKEL